MYITAPSSGSKALDRGLWMPSPEKSECTGPVCIVRALAVLATGGKKIGGKVGYGTRDSYSTSGNGPERYRNSYGTGDGYGTRRGTGSDYSTGRRVGDRRRQQDRNVGQGQERRKEPG